MSKSNSTFLHPIGISATIALSLLAPATGQAQQIVTSAPQNAAQTAAFWTAERKAAAKPMPLRTVSGTPAAAPASAVAASSRTPGSVSGNLAAGEAIDARVARAAGSAQVTPTFGPGSTIWYNYPPPSTLVLPTLDYFVVPLYPNKALGKLFFTVPGGTAQCSAQSVTSAGSWGAGNRQTVVTAGHCCTGNGSFFNNWLFEPAHVNGSAPFGTWVAHAATVYNAWLVNEDLSRDFCVLQMRKLGGQNVNDAIGALGYAWGQTLPQAYAATGWPAAAPFTGGLLYHVFASDAETDTAQAGVYPFTHGIGNVMTGGSSGGAWIKGYQTVLSGTTYNLFNGLNSYKYTNPARPDEMFGPYVDADFVNTLFKAVATAPPAP